MSGSPSERLMRDALVARLRSDIPQARIVHELKVADGTHRADVAAISHDRLLLFEIKSERDTLKRAERQINCFSTTSHGAVLLLHERWFDRTPYQNGKPRFCPPESLSGSRWQTWCFPEEADTGYMPGMYRWRLPRLSLRQPPATSFLGLLWKAELLSVAHQHRVSASQRDNMTLLIEHLAWHLTGREICHAVCAQLRSRPFAEADPPVGTEAQA